MIRSTALATGTTASSFADVHTQSPVRTNCTLVSGGMDDRFDFQLVTGELLDGEGLSYIGPTSTDPTARYTLVSCVRQQRIDVQ